LEENWKKGVRMRAFSLLNAACIRLQQQRRLSQADKITKINKQKRAAKN